MNHPVAEVEKMVFEGQTELQESQRDYGIAVAHFGLGRYYWYAGIRVLAIEHFHTAKEMFGVLHCPADIAHSVLMISRTYATAGLYSASLKAADDALQMYENLGLDDHICQTFLLKSRCLRMLDEDDNALVALKLCLGRTQRFGRPLGIAHTLEEFGEIYARKRDYSAARAAYEGSREQFGRSGGFLGQNGASRCLYNLDQLARMEAMPGDSGICVQPPTRW
jgi:tetratricopeptide (TPR) repeat protein